MSQETPQAPEQTTPSDASLAQMTPLSVSEQARIRRELRKQKVGQGADRLRKITQTQRTAAGFNKDYKDDPAIQPSLTPANTTTVPEDSTASDPAEIDISEHYYKPSPNIRDVPNTFTPPTPPSNEFTLDDAQLMQMLNPSFFPGSTPSGAFPGGPAGPAGQGMDANDPILQMMQQMMGAGAGGMPGGPGIGGGKDGLPPDLLNTMFGDQPQVPESPYAKWWKVLHVVCSVLLGIYAVFTASSAERWTGSKVQRVKFEEEEKIATAVLVFCDYGTGATIHEIRPGGKGRSATGCDPDDYCSIPAAGDREDIDHYFALRLHVFDGVARFSDLDIYYRYGRIHQLLA
ncbi:hypothetical protein ABW19_dt0206505 [Dactylella cylindrospora]|nr:hypothetical protein ABW19_dt0206505 [Dactylella cylindrospora]